MMTICQVNFPWHLQFAADNVDHNLCTLDGKSTFHGMDIIISMSVSMQGQDELLVKPDMPVKRLERLKTSGINPKNHVVIVQSHACEMSALKRIIFGSLNKLKAQHADRPS
jgi:hypothetical protein